jgi:signal transduction histidine kinase
MDKPLRVLIIEDSEDDSLLLVRQLKKDGYDPVYERVDSVEGLKAALSKQKWELIISDYVLPRFSALEALKFLLDNNYDIPCIIVSGRITDETAVAAMKAGARDYVMKDNLKRIGSAIERELTEAEVRRARRKSERDLSRAQLELRAMAHRVVELQEEERRSIARELHDEIGQSLTGLKLMMSQAARSSPENCFSILKDAQSVITELMQQVREMSLKLRPSMLDDLGLLPTLLWYFERYTAQTRIKVNFEHSGLQRKFNPDINTAVYRIIQEALTNVARYARVTEADIEIRADDEKLSLRVEDRGSGFDVEKLAAKASTGLSGMRERAQLLAGRVAIEAIPGKGTKVVAEIPLK